MNICFKNYLIILCIHQDVVSSEKGKPLTNGLYCKAAVLLKLFFYHYTIFQIHMNDDTRFKKLIKKVTIIKLYVNSS